MIHQTKLYIGYYIYDKSDVFHSVPTVVPSKTLCGRTFAGEFVTKSVGSECKRCKKTKNKIEDSYIGN